MVWSRWKENCARLACQTYRAVQLGYILQKVVTKIVINFDEGDLLLLIYYFKHYMKTRCEKMTMIKGNYSNSNLEIADCSSICSQEMKVKCVEKRNVWTTFYFNKQNTCDDMNYWRGIPRYCNLVSIGLSTKLFKAVIFLKCPEFGLYVTYLKVDLQRNTNVNRTRN